MPILARRLAARAVVPFLAMALAAPALTQEPAARRSRSAAAVTGRVVDAATGAPVPGVHLLAFPGPIRTVTDSTGAFRMALRPGAYLVWHTAAGYADVSRRLDVQADTALGDLPFDPLAAEGAARRQVSGTIVDAATGAPIRDARVEAEGGATTLTDEHGAFALGRVAAGSVYVSFARVGYESLAATVEVQGRTQVGLVALRTEAIALQGLTVVVDRLEERRLASGWSTRMIAAEELQQSTARNAYQLVADRTGMHPTQCFMVQPQQGQSMGSGTKCYSVRGQATVPQVFVDEVQLQDGIDGLKFFRAHEFERVEVFGSGRQIRLYTPEFIRWMSGSNYIPRALTAP